MDPQTGTQGVCSSWGDKAEARKKNTYPFFFGFRPLRFKNRKKKMFGKSLFNMFKLGVQTPPQKKFGVQLSSPPQKKKSSCVLVPKCPKVKN